MVKTAYCVHYNLDAGKFAVGELSCTRLSCKCLRRAVLTASAAASECYCWPRRLRHIVIRRSETMRLLSSG